MKTLLPIITKLYIIYFQIEAFTRVFEMYIHKFYKFKYQITVDNTILYKRNFIKILLIRFVGIKFGIMVDNMIMVGTCVSLATHSSNGAPKWRPKFGAMGSPSFFYVIQV